MEEQAEVKGKIPSTLGS